MKPLYTIVYSIIIAATLLNTATAQSLTYEESNEKAVVFVSESVVQTQATTNSTVTTDIPSALQTKAILAETNHFRASRTSSCDMDSVRFTQARATAFRGVNLNNATSAQAITQYFNAPQSLEVGGFEFHAVKLNATGGATMNVTCEIYLAGPDSLPIGGALSSTTAMIDTAFGSGNLSAFRRAVEFTSPVSVSQTYVLVVANYSPNQMSIILNNYEVGDGQQSWLASLDIGGNYIRAYNANVNGTPLDGDALFNPFVTYDLTTDFNADITCLESVNTAVTFTNSSSPILLDEMYNTSVFNGNSVSSTWDFGDGTMTVQDTGTTHIFATIGNYSIARIDTIFGWTSTCIDMHSADITGNDLVCPGDLNRQPGALADYTLLTSMTCDGLNVFQSPPPGTPYSDSINVTLTLGSQTCNFTIRPPVIPDQILYFEDFEGIGSVFVSVTNTVTGGPMTTYNVDGLTPNTPVAQYTDAWMAIANFDDNSDTVGASNSWYSPPGMANDWMVTPQINIPSNAANLSWDAKAQDASYLDGYNVLVSTTTNLVSQFTDTIFSIAAESPTWTSHSLSLEDYANQSIYIAFQNNSFDKFVLLIDDILVSEGLLDLALDSAITPLGEYHANMLNQLDGDAFELGVKVTNGGPYDISGVYVTCLIYRNDSLAPIASYVSDPINFLSSYSSMQASFSDGFIPTTEGEYSLFYVVSSDSIDAYSLNDTSKVNCIISSDYMARDNGIQTSTLGIGLGVDGVLGQSFDLRSSDKMTAISYFTPGVALGDTVSATLYHTDSIYGPPTTIIATTIVDTFKSSDSSTFRTLMFPEPIPLAPGSYFIGINEFGTNIQMGTTEEIFTPKTTWIYNQNIWRNNEAFNITASYLLRPILEGNFCSEPPTPFCAFGLTVPTSIDGNAYIIAKSLNVASSDDCTAASDLRFSFSGVDVTDTIRTFTCEDIGTQEINIWVWDAENNNTQCQATVEIVDESSPVPACHDITITLDETGQYDLSPGDSALIIDGTTDCSSFTAMFDITSFDCDDIAAPVIVQVDFLDPINPASTCNSNITVLDYEGGTIIYVDADAIGSNDGSSWTNAYTTLSEALHTNQVDGCGSSREIWVAQGSYSPTDSAGLVPVNPLNKCFVMPFGVEIYGGFNGTENLRSERDFLNHQTILDGESNVYHVIQNNDNGLDSTSILDGFYITGGNAVGINFESKLGGGVYNNASSPTINHCRFIANNALYGGAILNRASNARILNSYFIENTAVFGAGMHNWQGSTTEIVNCVFYNNNASKDAGAMYNNKNSRIHIINCTIGGNICSRWGGAVMTAKNSLSLIGNSILWGNVPNELRGDALTAYAVNYSAIEGGYPGDSNIDMDPQFTDFANGDLSVDISSPTIDAALGALIPMDILQDINGNNRIIGILDMGAYETALPVRSAKSDENSFLTLVHPNPTQDFLNVTVREFSGEIEWVVQDSRGAIVASGNNSSSDFKIDMSTYPNQVYMLTLKAKSGNQSHQIVKLK